MNVSEKRYLELLSQSFPSIAKASAEIVDLNTILSLPKGTELFFSDIHGEYEAFSHILRNASGSIRLQIDAVFGGALNEQEKRSLATLIYYPHEKMALTLTQVDDSRQWYLTALSRLVVMCRQTAKKYTSAQVRKMLPPTFANVIENLLAEDYDGASRKAYHATVIDAAIEMDCANNLIESLCLLIQQLSVERLHVMGDVYDRGPQPEAIMDTLMNYHSLDIVWGNHDIVWMGASLGQRGCIAHVVRNCARYGNLSILGDAYGINILPLASFALNTYRDDPCVGFVLKGNPELSQQDLEMNVKIQKAMAIIQFKVEAKLIDDNPSFELEDRKLLHRIDYEAGTVELDGKEYELTDKVFPTVDPDDPYKLTEEEEEVMQCLVQAFTSCEKLQRHIHFFLDAGSMYRISDNNLLFHACVPLKADGSLNEMNVFGKEYKGRALYEVLEHYVRAGFYDSDPEQRRRGRDLMWYMWLGKDSPLFAKSKMATFEIYLIADKAARKEVKNPFYSLLDDDKAIDGIFEDFGMDPKTSRIVSGHVPVKAKDGEDPVKCNGRVLDIDGGFSRAYQPTTGIAGYTLISDDHDVILATHEPLKSAHAAIADEADIHSSRRLLEHSDECITVADTNAGAMIKNRIASLKDLVEAYRSGLIAEV